MSSENLRLKLLEKLLRYNIRVHEKRNLAQARQRWSSGNVSVVWKHDNQAGVLGLGRRCSLGSRLRRLRPPMDRIDWLALPGAMVVLFLVITVVPLAAGAPLVAAIGASAFVAFFFVLRWPKPQR
jgi:hypothetical protein